VETINVQVVDRLLMIWFIDLQIVSCRFLKASAWRKAGFARFVDEGWRRGGIVVRVKLIKRLLIKELECGEFD
jgi:hypothetical protein